MKQKQVNIQVSGPEEIGDDVFRTTLTHPLLSGKLSFLHSTEEDGEEILKALTSTWKDELANVLSLAGDVEELWTRRKDRLEREKTKKRD